LLQSGYRVITRLHPEATRKSPELDVDPSADFWMQQASLMISDWSGVVMEYAYGFEKPVLFIDLPRKINNPAYSQLGIEPMELSVRNEIGKVVHSEKSLSFQPK
jgi:YidC/Oxa1 family membrane protein insertase